MDAAKPFPPPSPTPSPPSSSPPSSPATRFIPPRTRFQIAFHPFLETLFAPLDDALVAWCQRRTGGFVYLFSMGLTFFTSIEISLLAPPALYCLGYDSAAGLSASVLLLLGVISQMPKKFIFRPRPWMVGRALPIRQDRTSSFPSRAVVCAVVFSWLIGAGLQREGVVSKPISPLLLWPIIMAIAALTAFARINVGAHYPSDTFLGFALGCVVVNLGARLELAIAAVCKESAQQPVQLILTSWASLLKLTPFRHLLSLTFLAYAITFVSIQGFWVKCSYVYGLLLSSITFRTTFVCTGAGYAAVAKVLEPPSFRLHVRATATIAALLLFGMLTRGKKGNIPRIATFSIIYFGALLAMLAWRLRPELVAKMEPE